MERFLEELPILIVTILLIAMITILLSLGIVTFTNPFVDIITSIIIPFWFLQGAFKWQPKTLAQKGPQDVPIPTPVVVPAPALASPISQQDTQTMPVLPYGPEIISLAPGALAGSTARSNIGYVEPLDLSQYRVTPTGIPVPR